MFLLLSFKIYNLKITEKQKPSKYYYLLDFVFQLDIKMWGEQDSNLRSSHSRFTVCPRWPLEYLPNKLIAYFTAPSLTVKSSAIFAFKASPERFLAITTPYWFNTYVFGISFTPY